MREVKAQESGYVESVDSKRIGLICTELGGGRKKLGDVVKHSVGISIRKKTSDKVNGGDILAELHTQSEGDAVRFSDELRSCFVLSGTQPAHPSLVVGEFA